MLLTGEPDIGEQPVVKLREAVPRPSHPDPRPDAPAPHLEGFYSNVGGVSVPNPVVLARGHSAEHN